MVVVYHAWTASLHYIDSIDEANKIVPLHRSQLLGRWARGQELRFHVENVRELLSTRRGEWYLDRKTGVLTYYPRPGEDMTRPRSSRRGSSRW